MISLPVFPPARPDEFALDYEGLAALERRLNEAIDSGELGPVDASPPAPIIVTSRAAPEEW